MEGWFKTLAYYDDSALMMMSTIDFAACKKQILFVTLIHVMVYFSRSNKWTALI